MAHWCNLTFLNISVHAEVVFVVHFIMLVLVYRLDSLTYQCMSIFGREELKVHV